MRKSVNKIKKPLLQERTLYRDEIFQYLQDLIINKVLKPGDRIVETRIAKELGVSQSPVREAIRELEIIGLAQTKPYSGTYVRKISKKEIIDNYVVRRVLEECGAAEALKVMTVEDLKQLEALMQEVMAAANKNNIQNFIIKNAAFHEYFMKLAGNEILLKFWQQCHILEWTHFSTVTSAKDMPALAERHLELYEAFYAAFKEKNADKVLPEISNHIDELIKEIRESWSDDDNNDN